MQLYKRERERQRERERERERQRDRERDRQKVRKDREHKEEGSVSLRRITMSTFIANSLKLIVIEHNLHGFEAHCYRAQLTAKEHIYVPA